jgi:hypothetical protein
VCYEYFNFKSSLIELKWKYASVSVGEYFILIFVSIDFLHRGKGNKALAKDGI